jgi:hypothetical protein
MPTTSSIVMNSVPPLLGGPLFVTLFMWLAMALGLRILSLLGARAAPFKTSERAVVAVSLGAGCLQYLPYGLQLFGLMTPSVIRLAMGLLTLLLVTDLVRVARRVPTALTRFFGEFRSPQAAVWLSLVALHLAVVLVRSVVLGNMGDDDGYHLTAPRRWLEAGALVYLPTYGNTNSPMGFEMLYAMGLASWSVVGAKLLHYGAGALSLLALYLSACRLSGRTAGMFAIALVLALPYPMSTMALFTVAYNDLAVCWMTTVSILIWLVWRENREPSLLRCSALCAGLAGSFKSTALSVGVAWLALVLETGAWRAAASNLTRLIRRYGVFVAAPILPWLYRNWSLTGNPVYPMLASLIPTRDWSPEQGRVFGGFVHYYGWALRYGAQLGETERKEIILVATIGMLVFFAAAILRTRRDEYRRVLAFSCCLFTAAMAVTGLYLRYWLPGILSMSLVLGCLIADARMTRHWVGWSALLLTVGGLALTWHNNSRNPSFRDDLLIGLGRRSLDERYKNDSLWNAWKYLNTDTNRDARVLAAAFYPTFGTMSGGMFWVERTTYVTDSLVQRFFPFDDWPAFLTSIHRARINYVVIFDKQYTERQSLPFEPLKNEYPFCRRLVDEYGDLVYKYEDLGVYRLRDLSRFVDTGPLTPSGPSHEKARDEPWDLWADSRRSIQQVFH